MCMDEVIGFDALQECLVLLFAGFFEGDGRAFPLSLGGVVHWSCLRLCLGVEGGV